MRSFVPGLVVFGAFVLVSLIGAIAFVAAGTLALRLDASANESHLTAFIVAIIGVAVAVACALPIFGHAVPWAVARLDRVWPRRPPGPPVTEIQRPS